MTGPTAQARMKALVVSRLMLGDIDDWRGFEQERNIAGQIANRHTARSVSSQIGRSYRALSVETQKFISNNFDGCDYDGLARLCDAIEPGFGLYLRLDEFEKCFFGLAETVKRRVPFYTHLSISTYGLQFEYPEHHFLGDLAAAFEDLEETRQRIHLPGVTAANVKGQRNEISRLVGREKFICRSMVSASFSLVEAFLSGLFFTALNAKAVGKRSCDEDLLNYATKKESAPLKDRLDRIVRFASSGTVDGRSEPFKSFIDIGKNYRDAIHHTTPFERKGSATGQRLLALYEINANLGLLCAILSLGSVLAIADWIYDGDGLSAITDRCKELREKILIYSVEQGICIADDPSIRGLVCAEQSTG